MIYDHIKNNYAEISGRIESGFEYSHEVFGERFYKLRVRTSRLSESSDVIPLIFSERIVDVRQDCVGHMISVSGQFRSFNDHSDDRSHLVLYLFVRAYAFSNEELTSSNMIYLDGYLCKEPVYRVTPRGKEICDLLLAVNRSNRRSDYIPCICWMQDARYAADLTVGSRVRLWGRIQSRNYKKRLEDDTYVIREAFEVSVSTLEDLSDPVVHYGTLAGNVAEGRSYFYENPAH